MSVKNLILVDYENVNNEGLRNIDKLKDEDLVFIFYSNNADKISFDVSFELQNSKAEIKYFKVKVDKVARQMLDFRIHFMAGFTLSYYLNKYDIINLIIISADTDYNNIKDCLTEYLEIKNKKINFLKFQKLTDYLLTENNLLKINEKDLDIDIPMFKKDILIKLKSKDKKFTVQRYTDLICKVVNSSIYSNRVEDYKKEIKETFDWDESVISLITNVFDDVLRKHTL